MSEFGQRLGATTADTSASRLSRRQLLLSVGVGLPAAGLLLADGRPVAAAAAPAIHIRKDGGGGDGEPPADFNPHQAVAGVWNPEFSARYGVSPNVAAECPQWYESTGIDRLSFMSGPSDLKYRGSERLNEGELRVMHSGDLQVNNVYLRADNDNQLVIAALGAGDYQYVSEGGWTGKTRFTGERKTEASYNALLAQRFAETIKYKPGVEQVYLIEQGSGLPDGVKTYGRGAMEKIIQSAPYCP